MWKDCFVTMEKHEIKGMLQQNIEHFLKKHIYEKLGIPEMK